MNFAIDACSAINLYNAEALESVCMIPNIRIFISNSAKSECKYGCETQISKLIADGLIQNIEDSAIPVSHFLEIKAAYGLGDGETESIVACQALGYTLISDDGAARKIGIATLGQARVIGSIRLLRLGVEFNLFDCAQAFLRFKIMVAAGGFLPQVSHGFFCDKLPGC